jgi:hypothetical protein
MKIAGIYIDKSWTKEEIENNKVSEFGLHLGHEQVAWFADGSEISDLHQDVEFGSNGLVELKQCTFGINKSKKEWHIKDNTKSSEKAIIAKGKYYNFEHVEKQVDSFIRTMTGIK